MLASSSVADSETTRFDYSGVDRVVADRLKRAADEIRATRRSMTLSIIKIGATLLEVKECLSHGQFGDWLEKEFGCSERTAQNYMRAAEVFKPKSAIVADLPTTLIYKLTAPSTPAHIRDKVVADLEAGQRVDCRAVASAIGQARSHPASKDPGEIEKATQEATNILAKLTIAERDRLLRILSTPGVLRRLSEASSKPEQQAEPSSKDYPDLPAFLDRALNETPCGG